MTDTKRRGRGRPPTGVRVEANIPADILGAIDQEAADLGLPRAAMIREVLEQYVRDQR
jgi:predicted DNA binding CopG/RHH family protein